MTTVVTPIAAHLHPSFETRRRTLVVAHMAPLTETITHFVLADPAGGVLTAFEPGSHLIVSAGEHRNAYSLVGDGMNPRNYAISVMRRGAGGGSDWLHDHVRPGALVEVEGPRSMFAPVHDQRHSFLVAGGIGVTPVLSHARAAIRWGRSAEIVYSYRSGHGAHRRDLRELTGQGGCELHEVTTVEGTVKVLRDRFADQPLGAHAYACGPAAMLETYLELGLQAGWPLARLHLERFEAPQQPPGDEFTVTMASTGRRIVVPSGVSLLEKLLDNDVPVANLCRQGVCGECRIPVRSGRIEHRDYVLSDDEKEAGESMLCCVSRGEDIEVDL